MKTKEKEDKEVIILQSLREAYYDYYDLVEEVFLKADEALRFQQLGYTDSQIENMDFETIQELTYKLRHKRFLKLCIDSGKIVKSQFGYLLTIK